MNDSWGSLVFGILFTVLLAGIIHYGCILVYPYLVMSVAMRKGLKLLGKNTITHGKKPTSEFRDIVRPSPDLIYSGCIFDLSAGPLRIHSVVPLTYMSLSMYADNTDNFFRINDMEIDDPELELVLIGPNISKSELLKDFEESSSLVVQAPSQTGILLFRYFYGDGAHAQNIEAVRQQTTLTYYHGSHEKHPSRLRPGIPKGFRLPIPTQVRIRR